MRTLIAEDDFLSRNLLLSLLSPYGRCDVAVNGREAFKAFEQGLENGRKYDLVCLDIMMPMLSGKEVLMRIRKLEKQRNLLGLSGVKIIMTTVIEDPEMIMDSFKEQCDAYIVKPIDLRHLQKHLIDLGLLDREDLFAA